MVPQPCISTRLAFGNKHKLCHCDTSEYLPDGPVLAINGVTWSPHKWPKINGFHQGCFEYI